MKKHLLSCVLACAAIVGITSVANAQVYYGVVGDGIHQQYGPQDVNGNYMGIASCSYDWYDHWEWDAHYVGPNSGDTLANGGDGYLALALNPYTGEVWTDIPAEIQGANPDYPAGYVGNHHAIATGDSGLPDDPGTPDVDESVVYSDYVANTNAPATGLTEDVIYFTVEHRHDGGGGIFGLHGRTSPDGGFLSGVSTPSDWYGTGVREEFNMPQGMEVRTYTAADPDNPTGEDLDFDPVGTTDGAGTDVLTHDGAHNWYWYTGTAGGGSAFYGRDGRSQGMDQGPHPSP